MQLEYDADCEQMETQHWLIEASDCGYLTGTDFRRLLGLCEEIGRMVGSMMRKAELFASNDSARRAEPPPYLANDALDFEPQLVSTYQ